MIVAFSVSPAGGESDSVSAAVAEAVRVVREVARVQQRLKPQSGDRTR